MILICAKSNASKFTFFAIYQYRSSRMPIAEATPIPIAQDGLQEHKVFVLTFFVFSRTSSTKYLAARPSHGKDPIC